jgi:hypothetical protein
MSFQVQLCFDNGQIKELTISPDENIGEKKRQKIKNMLLGSAVEEC